MHIWVKPLCTTGKPSFSGPHPPFHPPKAAAIHFSPRNGMKKASVVDFNVFPAYTMGKGRGTVHRVACSALSVRIRLFGRPSAKIHAEVEGRPGKSVLR